MTADTYNQMFTLHGAIMIFLFIIPGIPAALGNFVLPLMLGAKDVAFPRLNLASFYLCVVGALFSLVSLVARRRRHRLDLLHALQHDHQHARSIAVTLGAFILGFSSIFTGLNFIVTIHTLRPPGMTWFQHAAVPLGALRHRASSRCWPRRCSASRCCC